MKNKPWADRPLKDLAIALAPSILISAISITAIFHYTDPAPPHRLLISIDDEKSESYHYAKQYKEILKEDGIDLVLKSSKGSAENYQNLKNSQSEVEAGFVHDGFGSPEEAPDLVSLGSLYYEPIWIFYRNQKKLNRISDFIGKKIAIGREGGGVKNLIYHLLKASGIREENTKLIHLGWNDAAMALKESKIDVAFFLATPQDLMIDTLLKDPEIKLMNLDQAEAITKQFPYLHHLVLPHGAIDLKQNIPNDDIHLVSPTVTLLVKDSLHPSLMFLLLKAATQVHGDSGLFEKKNEFPEDKDYQFPLADEAKSYFKSGPPFWQKLLPFWIASLIDRFILIAIPALAVVIPLFRMIPKFYQWRVRNRIYRYYGELKFLETKIKAITDKVALKQFLIELDKIEDRVNQLKLPLDFSDHLYSLRGHIDFVRQRLQLDLMS